MYKVNFVNKKIGNVNVLNGINFKIEKNDVIGIIGPYGSGKTTLMNVLAGVCKPTSGSVEYNYQNIFGQGFVKLRKNIGYAPQAFMLYPKMKVYDYLFHVCILKDLESKKACQIETERILHLFNMQDIRNNYICHLTRTTKQKLNIAQALIGNPEILLFDDPTYGLDIAQANDIRKIIGDLSVDHTIVLATHILPEATEMCNRIIVIDNGRVIANDEASNISKDFCERNLLVVTTEGDRYEIREIFETIPGIIDFKIEKLKGNKLNAIAEVEKENDIRKEVFQKLTNAHMPIHNMNLEPVTLDELFKKLDTFRDIPLIKKAKVVNMKTKKIISFGGK